MGMMAGVLETLASVLLGTMWLCIFISVTPIAVIYLTIEWLLERFKEFEYE